MWKAEDKYGRDSIRARIEALWGLSTLSGYDHGQLLSYYQGNSEASLAAMADLIYHLHYFALTLKFLWSSRLR